MEYDNTNSGSFFVNDRKQKETHPDYTGKINVEGNDYYLKGWKKKAKSGTNFMSLAVSPVEQKAQATESASYNTDSPF